MVWDWTWTLRKYNENVTHIKWYKYELEIWLNAMKYKVENYETVHVHSNTQEVRNDNE